jgi:hypothetical protein
MNRNTRTRLVVCGPEGTSSEACHVDDTCYSPLSRLTLPPMRSRREPADHRKQPIGALDGRIVGGAGEHREPGIREDGGTAEDTVAERPDAYLPHPLESAFPLGSEIICSEEPELSLILHLDYAAVRVA